jgi:hypothetical protein
MTTDRPKSATEERRVVLEQRLDEARGRLESLRAEHRAAAYMTGDRRYRTCRSIEKVIGQAEQHRSMLDRELQELNSATQASESQKVPNEDSIFSHSDDYSSIKYKGVAHSLTRNQSTIIGLLHKAHLGGTPLLHKSTLLSAIQAETSRVRDSFKGSALWGKLIVPNGSPRSTYRLNLE